jgi:hypothetical protein
LKNTKTSIFGGISKFRFWAVLGKFWQFWVEFATLTVAESLPKAILKSLKPHKSSTMNPNATWKATIHTYSLEIFQKLQQL